MAPHPIFLPNALALPSPSHRDATSPSPCWAPHFMTHVLESYSERAVHLSRCRLSGSLRSWTATVSCSLQPLLSLSLLSLGPSLLQFVSIVLLLLKSRKPDLWTCVFLFNFSSSAFAFRIEMDFSFKSLLAIWSLSPLQFHYYFYLSIVYLRYKKYWNILILVLCLLCATPLVCSSHSSFALSSPFFSSWWQNHCELFTYKLVLQGSPSTLSRLCGPRRLMYLLIVGSDYNVMRFTNALHMRRQNLVLGSCLYIVTFEMVMRSSSNTAPRVPATTLICSNILISVRWPFEL